MSKTELIFDSEIYKPYALFAFESLKSGRVASFECGKYHGKLNTEELRDILRRFTIIGFNSINFDMAIVGAALAGLSTEKMKEVANAIIVHNVKPWLIAKQYGFKLPSCDHIDLIETAPGVGVSLKGYAGRLHAKRLQDLPIEPEADLTLEETELLKDYCINSDIPATKLLYNALHGQLELRRRMGEEYGEDLRSKSEAQVAEAVIKARLKKLNGETPERPLIGPGTCYRYNVPAYIKFETPQLQQMLEDVRAAEFVVSASGSIEMPKALNGREIQLGCSVHRMGIGGLHSSEETTAHYADADTILVDRDVESFYPRIITTLGLFPKHLGRDFLVVFGQIVDTRIEAKQKGNKVVADSLKIVINGTFGKLGSRWSILYAPDLMIQVTVTGQLALLMLIERMELAGIAIISANTDGIVMKCPKALEQTMLDIVAQWERDTGFKTEETRYKALFSRDVNNYIAVKPSGKVKTKGAYANPWWEEDPDPRGQFMKNPQNTVCIEAVINFITKGVPIADYIRACADIRKFVTVVNVRGGGVWAPGGDVPAGKYLGKVVRFYHAEEGSTIFYKTPHAKTGNYKKVSKSDVCQPCMILPDELPGDIDRAWYVQEAHDILVDIGHTAAPPPEPKSLKPGQITNFEKFFRLVQQKAA